MQTFLANNVTYSKAVCQADSDGDGLTNGQELGDPTCVWSVGGTPTSGPKGHPGTLTQTSTYVNARSHTHTHTHTHTHSLSLSLFHYPSFVLSRSLSLYCSIHTPLTPLQTHRCAFCTEALLFLMNGSTTVYI